MIKRSPTLSIFIAIATTSLISSAMASNCPEANNPKELDACYYKKVKNTQKKLDAAYERYINTLAEQKDKELTQKAQNAWINFRDLDCYVIVPDNERYGVQYYQWASCMEKRSINRIKDLNEMASCKENGCSPLRVIQQ